MISLILDNRDAIAELGREFHIRKLEVLGSASTGEFDPETSDVDFIVDLGDYDRRVAWRFLDFCEALEKALGRPVDLMTDVQIRNPYFREAVEEQRANVYVASNSEETA